MVKTRAARTLHTHALVEALHGAGGAQQGRVDPAGVNGVDDDPEYICVWG